MSGSGHYEPEDSAPAQPFWPGRPKFFWFVLISASLVLALSFFELYQILSFPEVLAAPGWSATSSPSGWVVGRVQPRGPANGKLKRGDKLLAIDGDSRAARIGPYFFLTHAAPGESYSVEVERGTARFSAELRMASTPIPAQHVWGSLQVLAALIFLITGAMIGLAKPSERVGHFAYLSAALSAMFLLSIATFAVRGAGLKGFALWTTILCDCAFGIHYLLGYFFYSRFPQPVGRTRTWVAVDWILTVAAISIWGLSLAFNVLDGLPQSIAVAFADAQPKLAAMFALAAGASIRKFFGAGINLALAVACIRNFRLIPEGDQRRRLKWAFFGVIGALIPAFSIMAAWYVVTLLPSGPDLTGLRLAFNRSVNLIVIIMPITMTYAILKHRVLGIRVALRMGIQHLLATNVLRLLFILPLAALVYEMVSHRDKTISELLFQGSARWNLVLLVGIALSNRYRQQLSAVIDKRFFREAYNQEDILTRLASSIKELDSVEEIAALLSTEIDRSLHPRWSAVLYRQTPQSAVSLVYASDVASRQLESSEYSGVLDSLEKERRTQSWSGLRRSCPAGERLAFDRAGANLLVPIFGTEHRLLGALVLGEKKSEEPYTAKDGALLERVGHEAGIVYENLALRGMVRKERQLQADVLAHVANRDLNLVRECPVCGRCYDASASICSHDSAELSLSLPVERLIDGRYRLDRMVGKGGMGAVYEARDLRLNRTVAVKVMMGRLFGNTAAMRRFSREAQASAKLVHPNIVRLYDYGELAAEGAYLVLEYVPGKTWRKLLLERGTLDPQFSGALFERLLAGMEAAHIARIIHRDLKPDNVIVEGSGAALVLKILDFGLAKMRASDTSDPGSMTAPGVTMGTLGYMSPEQYLGSDIDERTDIYSIGVIALETLTGKLQLKPHSFHTQIGELVEARFAFSGAGAEHAKLAQCIAKCVMLQPGGRYASIAQLRDDMLPAMLACPPLPGAAKASAAAATGALDDPGATQTFATY